MHSTTPTAAEVQLRLPGDDLVPDAVEQFDRATTLAAPIETVWPWIVQLGKDRAGWYLPRAVEAILPRSRRALRRIDPRWQQVTVGDDVSDWGPGDPVLRAAVVDAPNTLTWHSLRDRENKHRWPTDRDGSDVLAISWTLALRPDGGTTRLHHRLRIRAKHKSLVKVGGMFDRLTIIGMFAGLRERVVS